jgi:hypothetical protein
MSNKPSKFKKPIPDMFLREARQHRANALIAASNISKDLNETIINGGKLYNIIMGYAEETERKEQTEGNKEKV